MSEFFDILYVDSDEGKAFVTAPAFSRIQIGDFVEFKFAKNIGKVLFSSTTSEEEGLIGLVRLLSPSIYPATAIYTRKELGNDKEEENNV